MYLIRDTSLDFLVPYVDPIVVLLVVLISISVPVRMAWQALMELLNRTPSPEIVDEVRKIITESTSGLPVEQLFVRVVQPGRTRMVLVHVVLPSDYAPGPLTSLDALRMGTLERLQAAHLATILDMVFTADPKWGAPLSESTHGAV
jgi:predicted Co/Zn/Cd cation transporter (cation efflux family)